MKLWLKIGKLCHFMKELILSDIQKGLIFATSAVHEITDELIVAQNENRLSNLGKVMGYTVYSVNLMGRAHK